MKNTINYIPITSYKGLDGIKNVLAKKNFFFVQINNFFNQSLRFGQSIRLKYKLRNVENTFSTARFWIIELLKLNLRLFLYDFFVYKNIKDNLKSNIFYKYYRSCIKMTTIMMKTKMKMKTIY